MLPLSLGTVTFTGLTASPCHGLADTGAQERVIGLWHFQRWVACLAKWHGLRPASLPLPEVCEAGGIGGAAKAIAMCDMPTGFAGVNGMTRWVVLDEEPDQKIPPLIPNKLLISLDAVIEPRQKLLTLRGYRG